MKNKKKPSWGTTWQKVCKSACRIQKRHQTGTSILVHQPFGESYPADPINLHPAFNLSSRSFYTFIWSQNEYEVRPGSLQESRDMITWKANEIQNQSIKRPQRCNTSIRKVFNKAAGFRDSHCVGLSLVCAYTHLAITTADLLINSSFCKDHIGRLVTVY